MKHKESGSTIVLSMIIIVVLAMCVAGALDYTTQTYRDTQQADARSQAVAAATGALDLAYVQFVAACRAQENVPLTAAQITSGSGTGWTAPTYASLTGTTARPGSFMNIPGVANPITVTLHALDATNPASIANPLSSATAPVPTEAGGITMDTWSYLAQATASYQAIAGVKTVTVSRIFQKATESPWQYAIFYNDDLEASPGSTMNVTGVVQTNGNIYTGGEGGNNYLFFKNTVNYAGALNWNSAGQYDPNDADNAGDTAVAPTAPSSVLPTRGPTELPENSALLGNSIGNANPNLSDGYHEIIEPPSTAINPGTGAVWVDPLASNNSAQPSERYYYQAGVKILLTGNRNSPTVSVLNLSGSAVGSHSTGSDLDIYNAFSPAASNPAVTTNGSLYDNRQGPTAVPLVTIDISKILTTLNTGGNLATDGVSANIIYVDDETSTPGGVELINGSKVPANGLTVVSANPVYIDGDYNTGGTGSSVGSNSGSPTVDYVSGYTVQPCAVMGDAVTILSDSWVNGNSHYQTITNASNTTINTAILSGIVIPPTNGATYTGAVENFPRLLENWYPSGGQRTFTYYGSMVELFQSKQATGIYQEPGSNFPHYYGIPIRQWYFDYRFYSSPPPGTFKVITYVKSRWFMQ